MFRVTFSIFAKSNEMWPFKIFILFDLRFALITLYTQITEVFFEQISQYRSLLLFEVKMCTVTNRSFVVFNEKICFNQERYVAVYAAGIF